MRPLRFKNINVDEFNKYILSHPRVNSKRTSKILDLDGKDGMRVFNIKNGCDKINVLQADPNCNMHPDSIILLVHGTMTDNFVYPEFLCEIAKRLYITAVTYDYPSYGLSTGKCTEESVYESLDVVISYYKKCFKHIYLIGQSLGTGVVVDYLSKHKWSDKAMLISPFKSVPRIMDDTDDFNEWCPIYKFDSYSKISKVRSPLIIIHGKQDTLIPYKQSIDLANRARYTNKNVNLYLIPNANHININYQITPCIYESLLA